MSRKKRAWVSLRQQRAAVDVLRARVRKYNNVKETSTGARGMNEKESRDDIAAVPESDEHTDGNVQGARERNGERLVALDQGAKLADQRLTELLDEVRLATDRVSLEAGYRGLEAWRQERPLNDHARIGGRPGMGCAVLTRHAGNDLLKGILKLSCEPNEISDGGAEGTGVARVGIGLPLSTTTLGKMGAPLTEKSRRPVSTGSSSETEVEAWAGPILPVTVSWGFPTVTTVVRVFIGGTGYPLIRG